MDKFVVISDTHTHDWKAFGEGTGSDNVRMQQTLKVIRDSLEKAKEENAAWIHAGDIIHTTGYGKHRVASHLLSLLNEYSSVVKLMVWGNHDSRGQGGEIKLEESFQYTLKESVENLHILNKSEYVHGDTVVYGCGAQPKIKYLKHKKADIGVFHQMVKGAKLPSGITLSSGIPQKDLYDNYRLSIVGDIHAPHLQEKNGSKILIPGAPEQHNFGDVGDRGWYLVTVDKEDIQIEDFPSDSPKFITVQSPDEVKDDGNFYRILGSASSDVPSNAKYVSSSPTVVESRNVFSIRDDIDTILSKWLSINKPEHESNLYLKIAKDLLSEQDIIVPQDHKLLTVSGTNFCSYKKFWYETKTGVTLVQGDSDRFESNGSGKTTLFEAIFWCLFGKTTKGLGATDVIRWGESSCEVTLEIELTDKKVLTVTRKRTPSLALEVSIDGEEVSGDTNKDLEEKILGLLGINAKLFLSLAYFAQQDVKILSQASDAEIKELISDLAGLTGYQLAASEAGSKATEMDQAVSVLKTRLEAKEEALRDAERSLSSSLEAHREHEDTVEEKLSKIHTNQEYYSYLLEKYRDKSVNNSIPEKVTRLLDRADETKKVIYNKVFTDKYSEIKKQNEHSISELRKRVSDFNEDPDNLEGFKNKKHKLSEANDNLSVKKTLAFEERSKLKNSKTSVTKEISTIKEKLKNVSKGICPECGQDLPQEEKKQQELSVSLEEHQRKLDELDTKLQKIDSFIEKISVKVEKINKKNKELSDKIKSIQDHNRLVEQLEYKEKTIDDSAKKQAETVAGSQADSYLTKRKNQLVARQKKAEQFLENKLETLTANLSKLKEQRSELENQTNPNSKYVDKYKKQVEELQNTLSTITEDIEEKKEYFFVYKYWNKGFGKSGIQSLLMDEIASEFNSIRSKVFPVLTDGYYDVQFSTTSTTASGELREKISFRVFDEGTEIPYESLSGGQARRVDVGVLLTMTAAICSSYGISGVLGIMILDEVTDSLDAGGAEAVAATLKDYVDFAVPSIYIVSHDPNLQSLFSQVMLVTYRDRVSELL